MSQNHSSRSGAVQAISPKGQVRIKKAERLVEELIGEYFRGRLPRNNQLLLSVTRVELSKDLKYGQVFVHALAASSFSGTADGTNPSESSLASKANRALELRVLELLEEHRPKIQAHVSKEMKSKFVPKVSFKYDHGWEQGQKVDELLRSLKTP